MKASLGDGQEQQAPYSLGAREDRQQGGYDCKAQKASHGRGLHNAGENAVRGVHQRHREGAAFRFVGVEQFGRAAVQDLCELPGEVRGVPQASVHALPAHRRVDVRSVPEDESAPAAKPICDAVVHMVRAEPVHLADAGEAVRLQFRPDMLEAGLLGHGGTQLTHDAVTVRFGHRKEGQKVIVVEADVQVALADLAFKRNVSNVEALIVGAPAQGHTDRVPHHAARAVTPGDEGRAQGRLLSSARQRGGDPLVILGEADDLGLPVHLYAETLELPDQQRFVLILGQDVQVRMRGEALADAVQADGSAPPTPDEQVQAVEVPSARHGGLTQAELIVELQSPGLHSDGPRLLHRPGFGVRDAHTGTQPGEPQGEEEAGGAGAGDQDLCVGGHINAPGER